MTDNQPSVADDSSPLVRHATADDADVVAQLLDDFNNEFDEPSPGPAALALRIRELLTAGDTEVLIGEDGDGLAVLRFRLSIWTQGLECYLAELYVKPVRRGQGLGRALMNESIECARQRGSDYMELGTSETDVAARGLYESLGFTNRESDGSFNFFYEREL
ncbi:MAG: GNAT family N-acetyltransferase [Solirubrobacterales bacterium]